LRTLFLLKPQGDFHCLNQLQPGLGIEQKSTALKVKVNSEFSLDPNMKVDEFLIEQFSFVVELCLSVC